jgi:peptidoglycan/LPS O-acetylase OafA/YrhL
MDGLSQLRARTYPALPGFGISSGIGRTWAFEGTRTAPSSSFYIPGLDGIRACAFLMVFLAHALRGSSIVRFVPATLGITIFFFLSGYLITTLLQREADLTGTVSLRDFYLRRALRILVPLYVVYALAAAVAHFALRDSAGNSLGALSVVFQIYNYTGQLFGVAHVPDGMTVLWSLAIEEHFYLLFPLAYLLLRRFAPQRMAPVLFTFCLVELAWRFVLVLVLHAPHAWASFATDARLDSILWGCLLALRNNPLYGDRYLLPRHREHLIFFYAVVFFVLAALPQSPLYKDTLRYTLQALDLYVLFSYIVAHPGDWTARWLEFPALRYIGRISYVLYLAHFFILEALVHHLPAALATCVAVTVPLGLALSVIFAALVRAMLELPLQRLRARLRHAGPVSA